MPKTKKSTRKATITNDRGEEIEVTQTFDLNKFKTMFNTWKAQCKGVDSATMGVKSGGNLFDYIKKHGIAKRGEQSKNPVSEEDGAGKLIDEMNDLLKGDALVSKEFKKDIEALEKQLNEIADSDADPRNIPFTVPIYRRVNKKNAEYDKTKHTSRIYGHYRTPDYVKYRNLKAKVFDNKRFAESIDAVDSAYYNKKQNTSKPPMWQALFSSSSESGKDVKIGLLSILQTVDEMIQDVQIEHLRLKLRGVARGGLAKELYGIDDIKETILGLLGNKDNPGNGVNKTTGNIRDSQIQALFARRLSFRADGPAESKQIKNVYGVEDLVTGRVKGYSLNITRGMVKNLFIQTGLCARRSRKGPIYLKDYVTPDNKKKDKKKKDVKKSWKEMLVV